MNNFVILLVKTFKDIVNSVKKITKYVTMIRRGYCNAPTYGGGERKVNLSPAGNDQF